MHALISKRLPAGFKVRTRLLAAFGLLVLLTGAVGSVGWLGFSNSQQAMNTLHNDSLPQLYQSLRLAGQSNALLLQAQAVANAKLLFQLDHASQELRRQLQAFLELIRPLPHPDMLDLAAHLEAIYLELVQLSRNSIFLTGRIQDQLFRLESLYRQARTRLHAAPVLDELRLTQLLAAVQELVEPLRLAAHISTPDALPALQQRYQQARSLLQAQLPALTAPLHSAAHAAITELLDATLGETVFTLRRHQFAQADRRSYLLTLAGIRSTALLEQVIQRSSATADHARERSLAATAALDAGRFRILLLSGVALAVALLFASYVVRDLGGNLRAVTAAMRELANGNRAVTVPATERRDEIGVLARTFDVFKENAVRLERASQELHEKTRLLGVIFDSMKDGLTAFDDQGRLVAWNTQFLDLYGLAPATVQGGITLAALHELLAQRQMTVRSLDGQLIDAAEINARRPLTAQQFEQHLASGRILDLRSSPMPGGGFVTIYTDLTERKAIEEQLRQAQKMETVGQLTGGIAHDFNNLLSVIIGNLDVLQEQLAGQDKWRTRARRALDAADRGAVLTQRLLAFSRKQALQPQTLNVNELIEGMLDLLGYSVGERICIDTALATDLRQTVIDPGQLENALMNLAVNARDAMLPAGGRLLIRTANRTVQEHELLPPFAVPAGHYVTLAVHDSGCGMTPELLGRVLEPFFTTKEAGAGSGLGLSMIYGFVTQSGGHLRIDSTPGNGSTVTLFLPLATPAITAADAATELERLSPTSQRGGETILIVEDDAAVRQLAVEMVQALGYRPLEAADGQAALALLAQEHEVNLLFTDVLLPGTWNGPALAQEARRQRPAIKVLYTSGYSRDALLKNELPERVELLHKPYDRRTLAQRLRQVLDSGLG